MMKQHFYLVHWHWLNIYVNGSFCKLEIDLYRWTFQFFTNNGLFNYFDNGGMW